MLSVAIRVAEGAERAVVVRLEGLEAARRQRGRGGLHAKEWRRVQAAGATQPARCGAHGQPAEERRRDLCSLQPGGEVRPKSCLDARLLNLGGELGPWQRSS